MTSHIVDVLADTTPIGHLDFDPPCCNSFCDNPAIWILRRVPCCPETPLIFLMCTPCRDWLWAAHIANCNSCWHLFVPARAAFYHCEPLKRGDT